jgi:tetratricopeptide (TPR) repeat protein
MRGLQAFVGHSFRDQDKSLISVFCEHFNNLAKANLGFTWDHAVEAEPSPLSDKVLAKIEGKNVFIGICTKNELAIGDNSVRPGFFRKNMRHATAQEFRWKTSDWIIQEIGLAVGRKMNIIIFLEENVREPGGLYGNIEYISFSRSNPQASFDKLLQMLVSISPKSTIASTADPEPPASEQEMLAGNAELDLEPKPEWTKEKYYSAMVRVVIDENIDALERITSSYRASKYSQGFGAAEWDGRIEWLRLIFTKKANFEKLKSIADEYSKSSRLRTYVARGYDELGEHEKAAEAFQIAASIAEDDADRARYDADAAIQYARAGQFARGLTIFENAKKIASSKLPLNAEIADDLRTLAQIGKDDELELASLERSVELSPADWQLRFNLAYKHTLCGNNDMALHHYTRIPPLVRDAATWNNLGVSFSNFDMLAKSNNAFKFAEDLGETLAMSNLGFALLHAGFVDEAAQRAKLAMKSEKYHANITDLLKRLKEIPEEEERKEAETLQKVRPKAAFYRQLGIAALAQTPDEIGDKWETPEAVLSASLNGRDVRIFGSFEQDANAFEAAGILGGILSRKVVRRVDYRLKMRGNLLVGEVRRTTDGESPSLLALGMNDGKLVMYFDPDRTVLHVMEGSSFYTWKRVN